MKRPDVEGIRARVEAASAGPLRVSDSHGLCVVQDRPDGEMVADMSPGSSPDCWLGSRDDACFFAAARVDVPELCDYVVELEKHKERCDNYLQFTVNCLLNWAEGSKHAALYRGVADKLEAYLAWG